MQEQENLNQNVEEVVDTSTNENGNSEQPNVENNSETEVNTEEENHEEVKPTEEENKEEKKFSKEELNNIIRERLERANKSLFKRYGVDGKDGIDSAFTKAAAYDEAIERYNSLSEENLSLKQELAFLRNDINKDRVEDIRIHFKGKELELNEENLVNELKNHPEWLNVHEQATTITSLGVDHRDVKRHETEDEKMKRIFGV